jgi:hypothetical protein
METTPGTSLDVGEELSFKDLVWPVSPVSHTSRHRSWTRAEGDHPACPQGRRAASCFTVHAPSVLRYPGNYCIYDNVFTWDIPKSIANFEKHGVPFEEAATVFGDANGLD